MEGIESMMRMVVWKRFGEWPALITWEERFGSRDRLKPGGGEVYEAAVGRSGGCTRSEAMNRFGSSQEREREKERERSE